MIKIRLHEDIPPSIFSCGTRFEMQRDIDYVIETQSLPSIATFVGGNVTAEPIQIDKRIGRVPSSILIIRAGGAGDVLFLTPTLAQLRRQFPSAHICVAASARYHWVLRGNKNVDAYSDVPIKLGLINRYDWVINLEDVVEENNEKHAIDLFAKKAAVILPDWRTTYFPEFPASHFEEQFPKTKKRIGIQKSASSLVRTYPRVLELQGKLRALGWEVALFTSPGELSFPSPIEDLINVGSLGWSWSKATDFLQTCDFVIGPDSSLIHFAGALGIPGIGLYASFKSENRLIFGGSMEAIQTNAECPMAPCFHHCRKGLVFPIDGPCNKARLCASLATITPESIIEKMSEMGFV